MTDGVSDFHLLFLKLENANNSPTFMINLMNPQVK